MFANGTVTESTIKKNLTFLIFSNSYWKKSTIDIHISQKRISYEKKIKGVVMLFFKILCHFCPHKVHPHIRALTLEHFTQKGPISLTVSNMIKTYYILSCSCHLNFDKSCYIRVHVLAYYEYREKRGNKCCYTAEALQNVSMHAC